MAELFGVKGHNGNLHIDFIIIAENASVKAEIRQPCLIVKYNLNSTMFIPLAFFDD